MSYSIIQATCGNVGLCISMFSNNKQKKKRGNVAQRYGKIRLQYTIAFPKLKIHIFVSRMVHYLILEHFCTDQKVKHACGK